MMNPDISVVIINNRYIRLNPEAILGLQDFFLNFKQVGLKEAFAFLLRYIQQVFVFSVDKYYYICAIVIKIKSDYDSYW